MVLDDLKLVNSMLNLVSIFLFFPYLFLTHQELNNIFIYIIWLQLGKGEL